jgi:hypothetical protein
MRFWRDVECVGHDAGVRVWGRAQADGLRAQHDRARVTIRGAVSQRGLIDMRDL